jgi:hypothetical protein
MATHITDIAGRALEEGWNWEAVGRSGTPETDAIVAPLLHDIAASLSDADRVRFSGHVPVVERPADSPEQALARAKLAHLLNVEMDSLCFSRAISRPLAQAPAFSQFPELRKHLDDDDMMPARLFRPLPDAFQYRGHAFSFSEFTPLFLRRKLSVLANQPGVDLRWRASTEPPVPVACYRERLEEAIDFGLPFRDELILKQLWTRHLPTRLRREPAVNDAEAAYDRLQPLDRLEVLRTERSGRVSFLFEALVPLAERHIEVGYVTTRIFHCDLVIGERIFEHVDSSKLIYRVATYEARLASSMKDKVKADGHLKLFWLASCALADWKALLSATYPRNELVAEYLTGVRSHRPVSRPAPP